MVGEGLLQGGQVALPAAVAHLLSFQAEFEYLLSDREAVIRERVRRAFAHLQRLLEVDPEVARKWLKAFRRGETHCEGLGSAHLLWHGIWAFKANAQGQRTDLVANRPLDEKEARRSADGLILTEWKLVRSGDNPAHRMDGAVIQAKRYTDGVLGGFEVASVRYMVLVGETEFNCPAPHEEGGIVYECVPIFLDRPTPSKAAPSSGDSG